MNTVNLYLSFFC